MDHVRTLFEALYIDFDRVMTSHPHELSGGIKQRTLIALALVLEPEVLVMDEPTAALDLLMQRSIISMLRNLRDEFDLTIVFITHDLPLVGGLADRIAVMYAFEFVEVGATRDPAKNAAHPYTRSLLRVGPEHHLGRRRDGTDRGGAAGPGQHPDRLFVPPALSRLRRPL